MQELSQTNAKLADATKQVASASELADRLQADAQGASQRHAAQLDSMTTELSESKAQLQQHISACAEVCSRTRCAIAAFAACMVLASLQKCTRKVRVSFPHPLTT
jgi:chromosome segregation ATPase